VSKNKINLRRVGIFSSQSEQPMYGFLQDWFVPHGIEMSRLEEGVKSRDGLDLVIAFGGDGTVLAALSLFPQCPVLAVNFGNVGFLTAGDREELAEMLQSVLDGNYIISERSVLECVHPHETDYAVNEIVIRGATRLIAVELSINDQHIRRVRGDGVIVGTPTGSTGHLLSTGAPIVLPDVRCMILDGVNEYNFSSRALILPPEASIRLQISKKTRDENVSLMADGVNLCQLSIGTEIFIEQAEHRARLVYLDYGYFFRNLSSKLSW